MTNLVRTKVGEGGRVIIPASLRHSFQLSVGDDVIIQIREDELSLTTPDRALRKIQNRVRAYQEVHGEQISLVDTCIALRQEEVSRE